jgi:hypothetical protein
MAKHNAESPSPREALIAKEFLKNRARLDSIRAREYKGIATNHSFASQVAQEITELVYPPRNNK